MQDTSFPEVREGILLYSESDYILIRIGNEKN